MKTRILTAALATLAMGGVACAQTLPPPPATGTVIPATAPQAMPQPVAGTAMAAPALPPGALPPLPPGCILPAVPPPAPPTPAIYSGSAMQTALGISASQAAQVRQVFRNAAQQRQRIALENRALDAKTCKRLHAIVGAQGFARWMSATPPPPAPPGGPRGAPPPPPAR